jgi:nucleotide-binding universal stress UspA family protein
MNKKLLIAVDGSMHANQGLAYTADLLAGRDDMGCVLIHIQPIISQYLHEEARKDPQIAEVLKRVIAHNQEKSSEVLDKSKQLLKDKGVRPAAIETVAKPRAMGLAKDILEYAHARPFEAIVAGRRGLARVQKIFMGSVSSTLADYSGGIPIWIVDGDMRLGKILVAIDVMVPWQPVIDHLVAVCAGMRDLRLIFYHVMQSDQVDEEAFFIPGMKEIGEMISRNEKERLDDFWDQATSRLIEAGFNRRQLEILAPPKTARVGKMIIRMVESQNIDTVLIGRRGGNQAVYLGSESRYVIERLAGRAVWVLG